MTTKAPRTTAYLDPSTNRPVYVGEGAVRQQGAKKLYECNTCRREVVWLESKRTGRVYLASVYSGEVVRYYISKPHVCRPLYEPEPEPAPVAVADPYADALRVLGERFISHQITRDEYVDAAAVLERTYSQTA